MNEFIDNEHKDLFPLNVNDVLVIFLAFLASALGAAGGIGGGGILVPLLTSVGGFSIHRAIPLTQMCVLGASIMNFVLNLGKRHPQADRPLIDFDTGLMLELTTLMGTVVGVDLNRVSPVWLITLSLIATLGCTTHRTLAKAAQLRRQEETEAAAEPCAAGGATGPAETDRLLDSFADSEDGAVPMEAASPPASPGLAELLRAERRTPIRQSVLMCVASVAVLAISLAKSSGLVKCGSLPYWLVKLSVFPLLAGLAVYVAHGLIQAHDSKIQLGYAFLPADIRWTPRTAAAYPAACVSAGVAAGLLGIGGGMLKGPIMLEMGLSPPVVAATAAYMLLFTTASTSLQFAILGEMIWDYAAAFFLVGLASSVLGQSVLGYLVRKYRKLYLITLVIGVVIGASTVLMGVSGAMRTADKYAAGESLGFRPLCPSRIAAIAGGEFEPAFGP